MINAYLTDLVTITRYARDIHGERSIVVSTSGTAKARFERIDKVIKDVKGMEVISAGRVILQTQTLTHEDTITYAGREYVILNIDRPKDFGWGYLEVWVV